MPARFIRGFAEPVIAPVETSKAVAIGDLVGVNASGNVVRAEDETWVSDLATTQANFVNKFLGCAAQRKVADVARVDANSQDNRMRVDAEGIWEFSCASASFNVGDLLGPAKQSGNALESQKVVAVADESLAIARCVEKTSSATLVKGKILSTKVPAARQLGLGSAGSGAGAVNGATVSAVESGDSTVHKTILTLASTPVTVANTTGASFGGLKLYDFPEGRLLVLGVTASLSFNWAGTDIAATGSGDFSLGTTITADASLATTEVDLLPQSAMTDPFVDGVGTGTGALADSAQFDGTSTAKDLNINIIIDDADVADAASDIVLVSGTITVHWINLGDY